EDKEDKEDKGDSTEKEKYICKNGMLPSNTAKHQNTSFYEENLPVVNRRNLELEIATDPTKRAMFVQRQSTRLNLKV
ncbi:MAG: hypothetical protein LDL41_10245, partial [Coleofasciculus sp. S288]|nr:hypothetical protein [Coleofasciculus sp. S288]